MIAYSQLTKSYGHPKKLQTLPQRIMQWPFPPVLFLLEMTVKPLHYGSQPFDSVLWLPAS